MENQTPLGIWTEADALNLDLAEPEMFWISRICDVMSQPVITIVEDKPIADAVNLMLSKGIRHIAVVDKNGMASGIVTQSDIIYSHGVESFMTVKDVKSVAYQRPWVIRENLEISKIVNRMRLNHTDIVIIHLDQRPMFSFTEHDVINLIAENTIDLSIGMFGFPPEWSRLTRTPHYWSRDN